MRNSSLERSRARFDSKILRPHISIMKEDLVEAAALQLTFRKVDSGLPSFS